MPELPYRPNIPFTGREDVLKALYCAFFVSEKDSSWSNNKPKLMQPQVLCGPTGVGKTEIAYTYVYRYASHYKYIFWLNSSSAEELRAGFDNIAQSVGLVEEIAADQESTLALVQEWLSVEQDWLLIFDGVPVLPLLAKFIPFPCIGHILITTRDEQPTLLANPHYIKNMSSMEGALFLLRQLGLAGANDHLSVVPRTESHAAIKIAQILERDLLAIAQAATYIRGTIWSLNGYLERYSAQKILLAQRQQKGQPYVPLTPNYISLSLVLDYLEQHDRVAYNLLRLSAFLAPAPLNEETMKRIFAQSEGEIKPKSAPTAKQIKTAFATNDRYGLWRYDKTAKTLNFYAPIQELIRASCTKTTQRALCSPISETLAQLFPNHLSDPHKWNVCNEILPHASQLANIVKGEEELYPSLARLFHQSGLYLKERCRYIEAAPFYEQALAISKRVLAPPAFNEEPEPEITRKTPLPLLSKLDSDLDKATSELYQRLLAGKIPHLK